MILSDNETRLDLLNNRAIAKTIVSIIAESKESVSIGVHGDWGAGKSSILAMVEDLLTPGGENADRESSVDDFDPDDWSGCEDHDDAPEEEQATECSEIITVRFNSWQYQGFEDAKIALMSVIVKALQKRAKSYYQKHPVKKGFERLKTTAKRIWKNIDKLSIVKSAARIAIPIATGTAPVALVESFVKTTAEAIDDQEKRENFLDSFGKLIKDSSSDTSSYKEMSEFRSNFADLYKAAHVKKLVVLIDDLDRCLPKVAIETLEAVRMFLSMEHSAFIIAADDAMIRYSVKEYFPRIIDQQNDDDGRTLDYNRFSDKYLEKLIQIPFHIPRIGIAEAQLYVLLLMVESCVGETDELKSLAKAAISKLNKPWSLEQFTTEEIQNIFGDQYNILIDAVQIAKSIGKILAENTGGNPRNIKRYVNMLLLRTKVAYNRGFSQHELVMSVLAKMMLAEQYLPDFYKALAAELREDGSCAVFDDPPEVEPDSDEDGSKTEDGKSVKKARAKKTEGDRKSKVAVDDESFVALLSREDVAAWFQTEPSLSHVDLRPYFFACTEKADFFFNSQEERLRELINAVCSGALTTASKSQQLQDLPNADAQYIFRIVTQENIFTIRLFDQKAPRAIEGIRKLVTIRTELQEPLVSFLSSLSPEKLGMWAVNGWDECIPKNSPHRAKLTEFIKEIADKATDPIVKRAANTALR